MPPREYKILSYAKSVMDADGDDFIIILRSDAIAGGRLTSYLLNTWQSLVLPTCDVDLDYLRDFIFELRQQSHLQNGSDPNFFESLDELSSGPLRTSSSGHFQMLDLSSIHTDLHSEDRDLSICSKEAFDALAERLKQMNHQLTAATSAG